VEEELLGICQEDVKTLCTWFRRLFQASGKVIRIQTKQVRAVGRATQGVRLIHSTFGHQKIEVQVEI
jgi:DNA gyrase/topoisomerase IV subunit A